MHFRKLIAALLLSLFLIPAAAQAQNTDKLVKIRILPERGNIQAGEEIWIGIEQSIKTEWHTYWKNPGDSGSEPRIKWTLPKGFEVSDIHWPTPHKLPYGPLLNYGYSDHVILLQKLTAPEQLPDGPVTLKADIEVLVCKEECIPEFSLHELTLNDKTAARENNAAYINAALSKLPKKTNQSVFFEEDEGEFILSSTLPDGKSFTEEELASMEFFPTDWGLVLNTEEARAEMMEGNLVLRQKRGDRSIKSIEQSGGVIAYESNGERKAFSFVAQNGSAVLDAMDKASKEIKAATSTTFLQAALFALLGGLVLNLMPCVFPVLSIKALSLVKMSEKHPEKARAHGLSYTAGVMLSFLTIAGILLVLKASGAGIGWGFQLQNPIVVSLLAYMLFLVGLNLSGYFEIGGHFGQFGNKLTQGDGLTNSFFTGVLATLVATPCTAPFMALAIGYALVQPAFVSLSVFAALGFGLALPYLALSFIPSLQKILPKPGAWMETFRQFLAFPMFASAAWLVWVLSQQAGSMGVLGVLFGTVALTFGLWLVRIKPEKGVHKVLLRAVIIACFLMPIALLPAGTVGDGVQTKSTLKFGETFSQEKLDTLLAGDDPVFVEMTAAWCITCKVNHAVAINTEATHKTFADNNVRYLIGDWTNYDEHITKYLNTYGREGVPLYVYYGPPDAETNERPEPVILPQILTPDAIRKTIEKS